MIITPPALQTGDTIGIICPSGSMPLDNMQTCIQQLQNWGYRIRMGNTPGKSFNYFSGTDDERLNDLQKMLDDENIRCIFCARGGYGLSRIIDKINFEKFLQHPKWIVGYSDISILHAHLYQQYGVASLHAPMAAAFNGDGWQSEYVQSVRNALSGITYEYHCEAYKLNRAGTAKGTLLGGNLCLLAHLIGSQSSPDTRGAILFIEDVGEYIYNIDRFMLQLQRAGMLQQLAGLVVGSFTDMKDTVIPFGESVYDAIYDKVKDYNYPVCFKFPVGHAPENYALKHGLFHELQVSESYATLTQKG